jgi:hypothetical protein
MKTTKNVNKFVRKGIRGSMVKDCTGLMVKGEYLLDCGTVTLSGSGTVRFGLYRLADGREVKCMQREVGDAGPAELILMKKLVVDRQGCLVQADPMRYVRTMKYAGAGRIYISAYLLPDGREVECMQRDQLWGPRVVGGPGGPKGFDEYRYDPFPVERDMSKTMIADHEGYGVEAEYVRHVRTMMYPGSGYIRIDVYRLANGREVECWSGGLDGSYPFVGANTARSEGDGVVCEAETIRIQEYDAAVAAYYANGDWA